MSRVNSIRIMEKASSWKTVEAICASKNNIHGMEVIISVNEMMLSWFPYGDSEALCRRMKPIYRTKSGAMTRDHEFPNATLLRYTSSFYAMRPAKMGFIWVGVSENVMSRLHFLFRMSEDYIERNRESLLAQLLPIFGTEGGDRKWAPSPTAF